MATLEEIQKTTEDLIRFQTTEDKPDQLQACAQYIADFFKDTNLTVYRAEYNGTPSVVVTKGTKTPTVFFSGHFDVVPGDAEQFEPYVEGDKLFGRGALDMKSGNAVMMHLLRDLAETDHSVGLMLTGDEEIGGFDGTAKLIEEGYISKVAIIPDGGEAVHKVISKEKGIIRAKLIATGVRAHGSMPWNGVNAIDRLTDAIRNVRTQFIPLEDHPEDHWVTTVNMGTISGGLATNQVPDHAEVTIDLRYIEDDSLDTISTKINSVLPEGVVAEISQLASVVTVPLEHDLVVPFTESLKENGREAEWTLDPGASDGRFFADQDVPVIISQPDGTNLHAPGEWVSLSSMMLYYNVLKSYIEKVA